MIIVNVPDLVDELSAGALLAGLEAPEGHDVAETVKHAVLKIYIGD